MKNKNRQVVIIFLVLFVFPGLLCAGVESGDFTDIFQLQGKYNTRVSIEKGWARDGNIPAILSFGELEIALPVSAAGLEATGGIEDGVRDI